VSVGDIGSSASSDLRNELPRLSEVWLLVESQGDVWFATSQGEAMIYTHAFIVRDSADRLC
jgi:hypothetical protein